MSAPDHLTRLAGKRVLVTAAGQGLGAAIALELLERGCDVAVHYRSSAAGAEALARRAAELGRRCVLAPADLTERAAAEACVDRAVDALGGLDILVNNAGDLVGRRSLAELDDDFLRRTFAINLESMIWVTQRARPALVASAPSAIVNLASLAGRKGGHAGSLLYSTTKGAVITWTRALSGELGPLGVRVNCVAPGLILGSAFHATHTTPESAAATVAGIPLGRAGAPADVARAVAYFASEYDGFVTGATLDLNGGVYCA
ncbi:MAG: SDR family oxidoreductase [Opitutaceae bacterium]|jgi:3-oxoacyl-[acyl-carrier protein] reductase|nr:SDR family oxidoreductase [Opitutaceae bacterium]